MIMKNLFAVLMLLSLIHITAYSETTPEKAINIPKEAKWMLVRWSYFDKEESIFYQWYKDGTLSTRGEIKNDKPSGEWKHWCPDGERMMDELYQRGEITERINYTVCLPHLQRPLSIPDGAIWVEENDAWGLYHKKKNKVYGWYINGEKKLLGDMIIDERKNHGQVLMWYQNGNLMFKEEYRSGIPIGLHSKHSEDGTLAEENYYRDGELIWTKDYAITPPSGLPQGVAWNKQWQGWKYKKRNKFYILYNSGKTKCIIDAKGLDFHGQMRMWQENGIPAIEGQYVNSFREGKWIIYTRSGEKINAEFYNENNKEVSRKIIHDFNTDEPIAE